MELLTPGIGLLLWQMLIFVIAILFAVSWIVILKTKTLDSRDRLSWLLGTLFLPIIGPVIFLTKFFMTRERENQS
jgi:hypothetical protein